MQNIPMPAPSGKLLMPSGVEWALYAARCGWRVFPLVPYRKIPFTSEATAKALAIDPANPAGCYHARSDEASIRALWSGDRAYAWIGLATGSGRLAIDIDEKNGKSGSATMAANGWVIPPTAMQRTLSGGMHYLVDMPTSARAPTDTLVDGIDRRGDGGHIVLYDPAMLTAERSPAPQWAMAPGRPKADRINTNAVMRAPHYEVAHAALRSRDPSDIVGDRNGWLAFSGAFYTATVGLVDDAVALADWQEWNAAHGETNDPAANRRAWADFTHNGTAGDFKTLARMAAHGDPAKAYVAFGASGPPPLPMGLRSAANDDHAGFFTRAADLKSTPPVYLVDALIERETLVDIFGEPGCGKTLIGLDVCACVATGEKFHGHAVRQGPVFYICGEGKSGIKRRLDAWAAVRGCTLADAPLFISRTAVQFLDSSSGAMVTAAIDALATSHGSPGLIVVDTVNRNFGPGDENSTADMSRFVAALDTMRDSFPGCTVLLVHHSGHGDKDRGRGSSVLRAALDAEYKVARSGRTVTLTNSKMKDAPPPPAMVFVMVEAAGSVALEYEGEPSGTGGGLTAMQQMALDTFNAVAIDGIASEAAWRAEFYERHRSEKVDSKKRAFLNARQKLIAAKILLTDDEGATYRRSPMPGQMPER